MFRRPEPLVVNFFASTNSEKDTDRGGQLACFLLVFQGMGSRERDCHGLVSGRNTHARTFTQTSERVSIGNDVKLMILRTYPGNASALASRHRRIVAFSAAAHRRRRRNRPNTMFIPPADKPQGGLKRPDAIRSVQRSSGDASPQASHREYTLERSRGVTPRRSFADRSPLRLLVPRDRFSESKSV